MQCFQKCGRKVIGGTIVSILLLLGAVCTLLLWGKGCGLAIMVREGMKSGLARNRLLCKTNYQTLLASSRDLLKMMAEGKLKPGLYKVARKHPSAETLQFPQFILDLAPEVVIIDERGYVTIEMRSSGMDHCGVVAYPEDFTPPYEGFKYKGQRMLIKGLWYYDDEYATDPEYDKVIDRLIKKGERYQSRGTGEN